MTDYRTKRLNGVDEVIRRSYNGHIMHFFIDCFASIGDREFIAIADDVMLCDSPADALEGDYDVVICKYDDPISKTRHKRYTNGFVVVRNMDFYPDCLSEYNRIAKNDSSLLDWWGDLDCMENVIDSGKYRVKFLPESKYCVITRKEEGSHAVLRHYYGNLRKLWMGGDI
jgi:hypothetical protein